MNGECKGLFSTLDPAYLSISCIDVVLGADCSVKTNGRKGAEFLQMAGGALLAASCGFWCSRRGDVFRPFRGCGHDQSSPRNSLRADPSALLRPLGAGGQFTNAFGMKHIPQNISR